MADFQHFIIFQLVLRFLLNFLFKLVFRVDYLHFWVIIQSNKVHPRHQLRFRFLQFICTQLQPKYRHQVKLSQLRRCFQMKECQQLPLGILIKKNLLEAFFFVICWPLYSHIVDKILIFRIVHTKFSFNKYNSIILAFPDLYSFGNVSTSKSWSRFVPRFYNKSFIAELPPLLKLPNNEAKFIILTSSFNPYFYIQIIKIKNSKSTTFF